MHIPRQVLASFTALLLSGVALQASDIRLTVDGTSEYAIVLSEEASLSEQHAARELQKFLAEISGAELPIIGADATPERNAWILQRYGTSGEKMIVLGDGKKLRSLNVPVDLADLGDDGFVIKAAGPHLVIAGGRRRGTMYGVYTFLEEVLGCRWFSAKVSSIPTEPSITLGALDIVQKPDFEYRDPFYQDSFDSNWAARNKSNGTRARLDETRGGRLAYYPFVHTFSRLLPPEEYLEEHPEYYSLVNGERKAVGQYDWQLCLSHPDVVRIATEKVLSWIQEKPDATLYSVSQNDGFRGNCECEKCKSIDAEEGSPAGLILRFVNAIAIEVEKKYPDALISTVAYTYGEKAPKITRPHRNVRIRLATIHICHAHPLDQCSYMRNVEALDNLNAWAQLGSQLYVWHYCTTFNNYLLPYPNLDEMVGDIRLYKASGVKGILAQGNFHGPGGLMPELQAYLAVKLLWNAELDEKALIADFLNGYFGKGGKPLGEFLDLLHDKVRDGKLHVFHWDPVDAAFLSPEILAAGERLFDEAEKLADNPEVLVRVRRARLSLEYVNVIRKIYETLGLSGRDNENADLLSKAGASATPEAKAATLEMLRAFIEECRAAGIQRLAEGAGVDQMYQRLAKPLGG
jgi:hypothetical protein